MFTPKVIRSLNPLEMDIYHFVMNHKNEIPYMTIREFAGEIHSSTTSVLRFCRKLGYEGFMEFKVNFKQMVMNEHLRISYADDKIGLFQDFMAKMQSPKFVDKLNQAVQLIRQKDQLFCLGTGITGSIASYAAALFTHNGTLAAYVDEQLLLSAPQLCGGTFVIFCVSGESPEMNELITKIKHHGGQTLLITNSNYGSLAQNADVVIAYHVYYAKSLQETVQTLNGQDNMDSVVDRFSTQLPTVYLIETLAEALGRTRNSCMHPAENARIAPLSAEQTDQGYALNEAEQMMYQFVNRQKSLVAYMTIREFAAEVHSSPPSILRFCRKLGYAGYTELKESCRQQVRDEEVSAPTGNKTKQFKDFLNLIGTEAYKAQMDVTRNILVEAKRMYCAGDGESAAIAYYAAMYFTASGKFTGCIDQRLLRSVYQTTEDLYLLFSVDGESEYMINLLCKIKESRGRSLLITNNHSSTLSRLADYVLPYSCKPSSNTAAPAAMTQLPAIYLVESLAQMMHKERV